MISLLHPSRSRIVKSLHTTAKWLTRAKDVPIELIVSVDEDDPQRQEYFDNYKGHLVIVNQNRSAVDAINYAAKASTGDIMIVVSDDTDCPDNWAEEILLATHGRHDFVLRVDDGHYAGVKRCQEWIIVAPIVDRQYYNRFGYIYHPDYQHQFCDTEFSNVAYCLGKVIKKHELLFAHLHPSIIGEKRDPVMQKSDNTWDQGKALYIERFKRRFDLDIDPWDFKGGDSHKIWLKHNVK